LVARTDLVVSEGNLQTAVGAELQRVQHVWPRLMEAIPTLSDEGVQQVRRYACVVGQQAWLLVCRCDAELAARAQARPGRGNVDVEGTGRMAGYRQAAFQAGVGVSVVRRNAQLYTTFFAGQPETVLGAQHHLLDKTFYEEALRAPDPHAAVALFAQRCAQTPDYSTRQARADVLRLQRAAYDAAHQGGARGAGTVTLASWDEWLPQQPACDLLLTDPPYCTAVADIRAFAAAWLPVALGAVKPTGRAYICIGAYEAELTAYLTAPRAGLFLGNVLVWTYRNTLGPAPTHDYKLNWQAILHFRGPQAPPLDCPDLLEQLSVHDIPAPDGRQVAEDGSPGARYHAWQKPDALAERLIRHATRPGDLILDPFCGTGTFVLAGARLGRAARGADTDARMLALATRRGCLRRDAQGDAPVSS
jgi:hypothetical protein